MHHPNNGVQKSSKLQKKNNAWHSSFFLFGWCNSKVWKPLPYQLILNTTTSTSCNLANVNQRRWCTSFPLLRPLRNLLPWFWSLFSLFSLKQFYGTNATPVLSCAPIDIASTVEISRYWTYFFSASKLFTANKTNWYAPPSYHCDLLQRSHFDIPKIRFLHIFNAIL